MAAGRELKFPIVGRDNKEQLVVGVFGIECGVAIDRRVIREVIIRIRERVGDGVRITRVRRRDSR